LPDALAKYLDKLITQGIDIDKDEPKLVEQLMSKATLLASENISIKLKAMKALYKNVNDVSGSNSEDEMKRVQLMQQQQLYHEHVEKTYMRVLGDIGLQYDDSHNFVEINDNNKYLKFLQDLKTQNINLDQDEKRSLLKCLNDILAITNGFLEDFNNRQKDEFTFLQESLQLIRAYTDLGISKTEYLADGRSEMGTYMPVDINLDLNQLAKFLDQIVSTHDSEEQKKLAKQAFSLFLAPNSNY
jgi:hypothetical protein